MTELIPTVQMESQHSVDAPTPTSRDFPRFLIISQIYRGLKSEVVDVHAKVDLFGKKDPLRAVRFATGTGSATD